MIVPLDGRLLAVGQYIVAFQGDILHQNDLVFITNVGFVVNPSNRIGKMFIVRDQILPQLRHGARRRQRQHADRYAQRLPNLPVHRFLPFLRFIVFLYAADKMDMDIIAYRHSFFNPFYSVLRESQVRNSVQIYPPRFARPHDIKSALPFFGKAPCIRFYSILARNALSLSVFGAPSTSLGSPCSQITP